MRRGTGESNRIHINEIDRKNANLTPVRNVHGTGRITVEHALSM
jgi:hypothetical protein